MKLAKLLLAAIFAVGAVTAEPFAIRGYYLTFGRMPALGFPEWKQIMDGFQSDGANLVILWVGGGFRSKKFPITWQYNQDHKNVQKDFVRDLIDYAHSKGIKILLGFTPFSYDGVNQYPFEHPELKAVQKNGRLARLSGIHCFGYALNPARPAAQQFMLDYVREMYFDFYPNADGLLIESSDYAICSCSECEGRYYQRKFQFVRKISDEVWARKADAMVLVYPHYFSGKAVPGFQATGAKEKFDPRWIPFFTPHSAHIDPDLIRAARTSIYWDDSPAKNSPRAIQQGAQTARKHGIPGYVPSIEGFSFVAQHPEGGESFLVGKRLKPFGFDWLADGQNPYNELPIRVNRIAYREFSRNPELSYDEFKKRLGEEYLGSGGRAEAVEDLLTLQETFFFDRSWFSASPAVNPIVLKGRLETGSVSFDQLSKYRDRIRQVQDISKRYADAQDSLRELGRLGGWVTRNWSADDVRLIDDHLR